MNIGKYGILAILIVLLFLMTMWDKIVASVLGVGLTLGALAILFGAGLVFGKLFKVF